MKERKVCYVKVRMADEIADLGCVRLNMEEHITGCGYNHLIIFKIWRGSMLNIPLNWRNNFSSKL